MKKILFIIAVLLSFTGYAQTVGQLRYDTVKMYKVGGTTELIIQNVTKDRTNAAFKNVGNGLGAWQNVVDTVFKNTTADSFVYYIGGVRRAFKDSIGTGSFARDTIVAGRGLSATTINANKVQLDNDSGYYAGIVRDDTLVLYRYNGDSTLFSVSGGGGAGWGLTGNAGTTAGTNFLGTTDDVDLVFKRNGVLAGKISSLEENTFFGESAGFSMSSGVGNSLFGTGAGYSITNGDYNSINGGFAAQSMTIGNYNSITGYGAAPTLITGIANTIYGAEADVNTSSTDSSISIGYKAVASTKQLAFSPHVTEIKATGITGASNSGYVLTTNGSGIATFQAASASSPAGNYGNIQINRNGALDTPGGDSLSFTTGLNVIGPSGITGSFNVTDVSNNKTLQINNINDFGMGDMDGNVNGTRLYGDDAAQTINIIANNGVIITGNITAHNIIGATSTQTDADFTAVAGTSYVLAGNNTTTRTITMPTLAEGDVFEFYNENTSANKWVSSATIYLSDNTTFTTLADDTNYILRYVGGKLRVSN